jgi:hypothetical protein
MSVNMCEHLLKFVSEFLKLDFVCGRLWIGGGRLLRVQTPDICLLFGEHGIGIYNLIRFTKLLLNLHKYGIFKFGA